MFMSDSPYTAYTQHLIQPLCVDPGRDTAVTAVSERSAESRRCLFSADVKHSVDVKHEKRSKIGCMKGGVMLLFMTHTVVFKAWTGGQREQQKKKKSLCLLSEPEVEQIQWRSDGCVKVLYCRSVKTRWVHRNLNEGINWLLRRILTNKDLCWRWWSANWKHIFPLFSFSFSIHLLSVNTSLQLCVQTMWAVTGIKSCLWVMFSLNNSEDLIYVIRRHLSWSINRLYLWFYTWHLLQLLHDVPYIQLYVRFSVVSIVTDITNTLSKLSSSSDLFSDSFACEWN